MEYTYEDLKKQKVADLRTIAAGIDHEAVQGATQMNKEHLLKAICTALNIDMHIHHVAHISNKSKLKAQIKKFKAKRDTALEKKKHEDYRIAISKIHELKRELRKAAE